ncbi:MAG: NAD(P)H-dependent oxidoreductase [Bryobacterales bacterium]|nr:NAD(P)H-dependent oxidoreductase [Bryobacterales bacterium]
MSTLHLLTVNLLAITGSLRANSSNMRLLKALSLLLPADWELRFYEGLGDLPHFNPDLDVEPVPPEVAAFREQLRWADAVVISSPEYAHGVPGSLKNALDWVVGSGELVEKPVALLNASPRSTYAQASLAETLRTMSAVVLDEASVAVPLPGSKPGVGEIAANAEFSALLRSALQALEAVTQGSRISP